MSSTLHMLQGILFWSIFLNQRLCSFFLHLINQTHWKFTADPFWQESWPSWTNSGDKTQLARQSSETKSSFYCNLCILQKVEGKSPGGQVCFTATKIRWNDVTSVACSFPRTKIAKRIIQHTFLPRLRKTWSREKHDFTYPCNHCQL